jgi:hypothetical protein
MCAASCMCTHAYAYASHCAYISPYMYASSCSRCMYVYVHIGLSLHVFAATACTGTHTLISLCVYIYNIHACTSATDKCRFLFLDYLLGSKLLQNAEASLDEEGKRIMALRHGDNLNTRPVYMHILPTCMCSCWQFAKLSFDIWPCACKSVGA